MENVFKNLRLDKQMVKSFCKDWIIPVIVAIGMAIFINKFVISSVYVPTGSMIPTINEWDRLLVTPVYNVYNIDRGNIIVFYSEELEKVLVKRVIGLPGDHIKIHNGIVNVNGKDIKEDYVKNNDKYNGTFDVPENKFFFLGDNRAISGDARFWINPYIDKSSIKGKAVLKIYPFKDFGMLK